MVKNKTPAKPFGKSPQNKGPQSMKKGGSPNKGTPFGKPSPKQQIQSAKGGQTPKPPQKNLQTPKQQLNFQTPKQTPKGQQLPGNKQQPQSVKKVTTPHPVKGKPQQESEDDDDEFDSEEFDEMESGEDESMEDESGESLEDEESEEGSPAIAPGKKQPLQLASGKKGQLASPPKKAANGKSNLVEDEESDEDDEDFEDEDEEDDEMDSEDEDEEDSDEDMEQPVKKNLMFMKPDKKVAPSAQKSGTAAAQKPVASQKSAQVAKGKAQAPQQQSKQVKRPAPEEESDDEDEEDEEEEDDEEDEDEEEEESEDDEVPAKGTKNAPANAQPQKKLKTNDGGAVATQKQEKKQPKFASMPTKLDKKLLEETEQRRRDRDSRSLFVKNLPRGVSDEDIRALSSDIVNVNHKPGTRWCWITFANEQVCQKSYEKLKNAKLGKQELFVDFCGEKSKAGPPKKDFTDQRVDALRLYIGNLPINATESDVKQLFPTASSFHCRSDRKFAFINFETPEKARQAFENSKDAKIKGANVVVSFARLNSEKQGKKKPDAVKKFADEQASGKVISRG